jgi:hypothetical protein
MCFDVYLETGWLCGDGETSVDVVGLKWAVKVNVS